MIESPAPLMASKGLLIDTCVTLISAGTERMLLEFGKGSFLDKARQQPEKVQMVLDKIGTDGLATTINAVRNKLAEPLALGYCNVGVVRAVGSEVSRLKPGQRVVSNGGHSEVVSVPVNLCCAIPENVPDEHAVFTVVASIGLQGIRLANPTLGESFVVVGAGLIGLLTVQLLMAQGCRVLAVDFDENKLALARQFGAQTCNPASGEDPVAKGLAFSRGKGVDAVIITASTKSSDPVSQAAQMSRKRGRIVLVGVTGLELNRSEFYEKELSFQVSCSYGPGRYDPLYEEKGQDYPIGFVRWTEQRNFEAVLDMMASGRLDVSPLITHRFQFEEAVKAYETLSECRDALGILLLYDSEPDSRHVDHVCLPNPAAVPGRPNVGFIGAGNYASRMLIPAFKKAGANFSAIATASGSTAVIHGEKSGFSEATTDVSRLLADSTTAAVAVVTRHNSHARFVQDILQSGKHVFVEKPLAINLQELEAVQAVWQAAVSSNGDPCHLMVGFNRRFAPHIQKMKLLLDQISEPKSFIMTMNAGAIPADHWTQDTATGGGRIVGEACHYIDLMRYLAGAPIISMQARRMGDHPGLSITEDKASITLGFENGSFGTIHYLANGAAAFPKERIEVFAVGRVLQIDNFRKMKGYAWPGFRRMNLWRQDKGQENCAKAFLDAIEHGKPSPIPPEEIFEVARV